MQYIILLIIMVMKGFLMIDIISTIFLVITIGLISMPVVAGLAGNFENPDACKSVFCITS